MRRGDEDQCAPCLTELTVVIRKKGQKHPAPSSESDECYEGSKQDVERESNGNYSLEAHHLS